jgi:hypothetical protein
MKRLTFNTGVKPWNIHRKLTEHEEMINGELHIVFYVDDIPKGKTFKFAGGRESLENNKYHDVRKIVAGGLASEYAFFK